MVKTLISGYGFVGQEVHRLFPDSDIHDPLKGYDLKPDTNYDFCFVNVPTPANKDGSCNTNYVSDVLEKVNAETFVIRSTIPPGTTDALSVFHEVDCVFQPEYVASSSPYPAPLGDIKSRTFHILGGIPEATKAVRKLYETVYPPTVKFLEVSATTAEVIKYMENFFIATYVTFCNEFYNISQAFNVDYDQVREGFLLDPRMTPWWTYVNKDKRGWGGHCLPKDATAIINTAEKQKYNPKFLKAVVENNKRHKGVNNEKRNLAD